MIQPCILLAETNGAGVLMHDAPAWLDHVIPGHAYSSARATRQWYAASSHPWDFHRAWHIDLHQYAPSLFQPLLGASPELSLTS